MSLFATNKNLELSRQQSYLATFFKKSKEMKKICKFSLNDPLEGWIVPIVWFFLYLTKTLHDLIVTINIREYQNQWAVTLQLLEDICLIATNENAHYLRCTTMQLLIPTLQLSWKCKTTRNLRQLLSRNWAEILLG